MAQLLHLVVARYALVDELHRVFVLIDRGDPITGEDQIESLEDLFRHQRIDFGICTEDSDGVVEILLDFDVVVDAALIIAEPRLVGIEIGPGLEQIEIGDQLLLRRIFVGILDDVDAFEGLVLVLQALHEALVDLGHELRLVKRIDHRVERRRRAFRRVRGGLVRKRNGLEIAGRYRRGRAKLDAGERCRGIGISVKRREFAGGQWDRCRLSGAAVILLGRIASDPLRRNPVSGTRGVQYAFDHSLPPLLSSPLLPDQRRHSLPTNLDPYNSKKNYVVSKASTHSLK